MADEMHFVDRTALAAGAELLSTEETNYVQLSPLSSTQPRLKIDPLRCAGHPQQTYWLLELQMLTSVGYEPGEAERHIARNKATCAVRGILQIQAWDFFCEAVIILPQIEPDTTSTVSNAALSVDHSAVFAPPRQPQQVLGKRRTSALRPSSACSSSVDRAIAPLPRRVRVERESSGAMFTQPPAVASVGGSMLSQSTQSPAQSTTSAPPEETRVSSLVLAVVKGARKFQSNPDRRAVWMKHINITTSTCSDTKTLNAKYRDLARGSSMHQWVSYFLYGCTSHMITQPSGTGRGRRRGEVQGGDQNGQDSNSSLSDSPSHADKAYRCRVVARVVTSLINHLLDADIKDAALNVIPALASAAEDFSQSRLCGWRMGDIEVESRIVARALLEHSDKDWLEIGSEHRIDPVRWCCTKEEEYSTVAKKLGLRRLEQYDELFNALIDSSACA